MESYEYRSAGGNGLGWPNTAVKNSLLKKVKKNRMGGESVKKTVGGAIPSKEKGKGAKKWYVVQ